MNWKYIVWKKIEKRRNLGRKDSGGLRITVEDEKEREGKGSREKKEKLKKREGQNF